MTTDDILNKEINDVRRTMRAWEKSQKELTGTIVESWRKWEKHIATMTRDIRISNDNVTRSKERTKQILMNTKAIKRDTDEKHKNRLEVLKHQKIIQDSYSSDVERHLRMRGTMKKTSDQFNFITQSLTKGRGLAATFGLLVEGGYKAAQASKELERAQKAYDDVKDGGNKGLIDNKLKDLNAAKQSQKDTTLDSKKLGKIANSLSKAGAYFERHSTGIMIGAGAAGILISIITKALSVAPMFQAMMKLLKFTVTMILMPIGTFFGALLRPILVGLIKGIAPHFEDWMKTSMNLGEKIGKWMMMFFTGKPLDVLSEIAEGAVKGDPAALIAAGSGIGTAAVITAVAKKGLTGILGGTAKTVESSKVAVKTGNIIGKFLTTGKIGSAMTNILTATNIAGKTTGIVGKTLTGGALSEKGANLVIKGLEKILPKAMSTGAKVGVKLGFKAIPVVGWATVISDVFGSVLKHISPESYEGIRQGAKGVFGDNAATEMGLDILGFGKESTAEWLHGGISSLFGGIPEADGESMKEDSKQSTENVKEVRTALDLAKSAALEIPPDMELMIKTIDLAKNKGFQIPKEMIDIVNTFNQTKNLGYDVNSSMMTIADMFSVTMLELQKKLRQWVQSIESAERKDLATSYEMNQAREAEKEVNQGVNIPAGFDPNWGGWGDVLKKNESLDENINKFIPKTLEERLIKEQEIAQAKLDARYDVYGGYRENEGFGATSVHKLPEGFRAPSSGTWLQSERREELAKELGQLTGGLLGKSYANGGWIREPVIGIGRNTGQTYSIGERGAEFVSPNGSKGGATININIAKVEKDADFTKLKPMIQRWILESNSRRGMI